MNMLDNLETEIAEMTRHMQARNLTSQEFATLCAMSIGCLIALKCDGNTEKAEALGALIRTARHWADMPEAH